MKKFYFFFMALVILMSVTSCKSNDGWLDLFNGKDLTGFVQLNGQAPFTVVDGCLVGTTVKGQPNSFLATEKEYDDFILEFEVLCDPILNSGVQFRSESDEAYRNGHVYGYQCEIDPSNKNGTAGIYDEERRGWLVTLDDNPEAQAAYKMTDWNKFRIEAIGNSIRIWLNGVNTANLYDSETLSGFIAFQIHDIGQSDAHEGKTVNWRNIRIKTDDLETERMQGKLSKEVNLSPNFLSDKEKEEGWKLLFDGKTTQGWRGAHKEDFPEYGWKVEDEQLIVLKSDGGESTNGGDIVTVDEYAAFELSIEFKITSGANSGIKYFVTEQEKSKGSAYGLEYQILDDQLHPDAKLYTSVPNSRTLASVYDMIPAVNKRFYGVGQWNQAVLKVFPNNHVEHWLNGMKVLEYERCSDSFRELVKGSKYVAPEYNENGLFGEATKGHILLQDHGDEVAFRSIKIKELK